MTIPEESKQWIPAAAILGLSLMGAALIAAVAFYNVHTLDNTLSVTGSATQEVDADSGKLTVSVSRLVYESEIAHAQTLVAAEAASVSAFFVKSGAIQENITISPVYVDQEYSSDNNTPRRYNIREEISLTSDTPALIEKTAAEHPNMTSVSILGVLRLVEHNFLGRIT